MRRAVNVEEPSGFSLRGRAPHFYLKPEISHYGGNCDPYTDCLQTGIVSVAFRTGSSPRSAERVSQRQAFHSGSERLSRVEKVTAICPRRSSKDSLFTLRSLGRGLGPLKN